MNYSKNTKQNIKAFAALSVIALMVVLTVLIVNACSHESTATDVVETVSPVSETPEATEQIAEPEPEESEEPVEPEFVSLGEFRITAYCGCSICCGEYGKNRPVDENGKTIVYTANQTVAVEGVTIAADISIFPYGTHLYINGHQYTVQDRGGAINGNRVDIYFENHQDALNFGVQYKEVFIEREVKPND